MEALAAIARIAAEAGDAVADPAAAKNTAAAASAGYRVVRHPGTLMLPGPAVDARMRRLIADCSTPRSCAARRKLPLSAAAMM